ADYPFINNPLKGGGDLLILLFLFFCEWLLLTGVFRSLKVFFESFYACITTVSHTITLTYPPYSTLFKHLKIIFFAITNVYTVNFLCVLIYEYLTFDRMLFLSSFYF
ncbi:MAG: hypothetical protein WAJ84_04545, partial [Candidatus Rhabdochlamydia sp.]